MTCGVQLVLSICPEGWEEGACSRGIEITYGEGVILSDYPEDYNEGACS